MAKKIKGDGQTKKYGNKKVEKDGVTFGSIKEVKRYGELKFLEQAGEIAKLKMQVSFELIPAQHKYYERYSEKTGKRIKDGKILLERGCKYVADFVYLDKAGNLHVEDTKSTPTRKKESYIIKRKLMLYIHGIRIEEI